MPSQDLVFVDETGSHIAMAPLYGYVPRGERAVGKVPRNYGAIMTLIASMSLAGMGPAFVLDGAADSAAFEIYVEQILAPACALGKSSFWIISRSTWDLVSSKPLKLAAVACCFCRPTRLIFRPLKRRSPN